MAYKRELISTNQPIQIAKSGFTTGQTKTRNGISVTCISGCKYIANGTATGQADIYRLSASTDEYYDKNTKGRKFYLRGLKATGSASTFFIWDGWGGGTSQDFGEGIIFTATSSHINVSLLVRKGVTLNNVEIDVELFDLTETFGSGNEPTTIAEFKQKFPNETYSFRLFNRLTSYKKLLKVSDVCQLHSPKNFRSGTSAAVSFESTDGKTWVVNGTTDYTGIGRVFFQLSADKIELIKNHHYLLRGAMKNWYDGTAVNIDDNSAGTIDGLIFEQATTVYEYLYIVVTKDPYTNAVFKPQLFDLTEMFGAGNEPTTVGEFKAKFPNELYDYSPRCWVKSYKTGLIAETKNLFNINALTPYTPETLPTQTAGRYNGNIITKCDSGTSVSRSNRLLKELCPNMVAGERYILHFDTNGTGSQANTIYLDGTETVWLNGYTHVVTEAELNGTVFFYGNYPSFDVATISDFQIEKGTTATDYVPYGYL